MNGKIVFGEDRPQPSDIFPTLPSPTAEKQHILTENLGLPEDLTGLQVLELFSGDVESSFKPEVLSRSKGVASNYTGVDLNESTGVGHINQDVYKAMEDLPINSFDFIIMNHPPIWYALAKEKKWLAANRNRIVTPTLADPDKFMQFLANCTRLIIPRKGNKIAIASGFPDQDIQEIWRRAATTIPRYSNWYINSPLTGQTTELRLVKDNGGPHVDMQFPDHSLQLTHY